MYFKPFNKYESCIGLIITAGNQSRFKSETPKCMMPFGDSTLLEHNLKIMNKFCNKCYVVCSFANEDLIYASAPHEKIVISSGKGCGDAVYQAVSRIEDKDSRVFIMWGDSIQTPSVYEQLINYDATNKVFVPCMFEEHPYVQIRSHNDSLQVSYSKFNENITSGWHDLSIFYSTIRYIQDECNRFITKYYHDGIYETPHGAEFSFLDLFNYVGTRGTIVEMIDYDNMCFNTVEEYNKKYTAYAHAHGV